MTTRLTLDQITIPHGRELEPDDDVTSLAEDGVGGKFRHPILVASLREQFVLIDGLRRMEAVRKLGLVTVEAVVTDDLEEACAHLRKTHKGLELSIRRISQIIRDLKPLIDLRQHRLKKVHGGGKAYRPQPGPPTIKAAVLIAEATNRKAAGDIEKLRHIYRYAPDVEGGLAVIARLEAGEITVNQAERLWQLKPFLSGNVKKATEQEELLVEVARSLVTTVRAATKVSKPVQIPQDRLLAILKDLRAARADLTRVIKALSEEISE